VATLVLAFRERRRVHGGIKSNRSAKTPNGDVYPCVLHVGTFAPKHVR
jgi:hypothetical protein